jgi:hypothetical protein
MNIEPKLVDQTFIDHMEEYRKPDTSVGLIEACSKSVIVFADKMLGLRLYAWQVDFLSQLQKVCDEPDRQKQRVMPKSFTAITSRQIGKTKSVAVFALWAVTFNKYPADTVGNHTVIGIVSALDRQAKELLRAIRMESIMGDRHMESTYKTEAGTPMFGSRFFSDLIDGQGQEKGARDSYKAENNTTTLTMKAYKKHLGLLLKDSKVGSIIKSYAPTDIVLGQTFTITIIDEMGRSDKITDEFMEYFSPTGNKNAAIRIHLSTPWESAGPFYRLVNPDGIFEESDTQLFVYSIDAIKIESFDYWESVQKEIRKLELDGRMDEVKRSYYCRFVKGETSYFNPQHVIESFDSKLVMVEEYSGPCDMGIDFGGQVKSKTVVTISRFDPETGTVLRLYHKDYPVQQDLTLLDDVTDLLKRFNVQRIIPDDCPAGDFLIRTMKEKGWNVHPMNFRSDKVKKYGSFRSLLARGKIKSYPDDALRIEMLSMEFSNSRVQSIIQHAAGYSDDLIDSFLMSVYFYLEDNSGFRFYSFDDVEDGVDPFVQ